MEVESIIAGIRHEVTEGNKQNMDCYVTRLESLISVKEDVSQDLDTSTSETLSHLHYRICHLLFQISSSNTSCSSITPVAMPTMYISNGGPG